MKYFWVTYIFLISTLAIFSQNTIDLNVNLKPDIYTLEIKQIISYKNFSDSTLTSIYLHDWNNSYSSKTTPLAKRFADEFNTKFYFGKAKKEFGYTTISKITQDNVVLQHKRPENHPDVLNVKLNKPLKPNESYTITLDYTLRLPSDTFTRYGFNDNGNYNLKYWYITPAIFNGKWQYYSNKNLNDLFVPKSDVSLTLKVPESYSVISELEKTEENISNGNKNIILKGKDRINTELFLLKNNNYQITQTDYFTLLSDISEQKISSPEEALIIDRIGGFLTEYIGQYPHKNLIVNAIDVKQNPIYGLNQLPKFIRPFPNSFNFEIKLLKNTLNKYLNNTLLTNPRKDYWLNDGLETYFLMKYIETYYPNTKLLGVLANVWGIKSFHLSDLKFNEQYNLGFMQMARSNRDQPLTMAKDSLLKFNKNIANKYKAGIGLKYLDNYINSNTLEQTIKEFLIKNKLKNTNTKAFITLLKNKTNKPIDWFFNDYINTTKKIDYKISKLTKTDDSITFTVKNIRQNSMPIVLSTIKNDSVTSNSWVNDVKIDSTFTLPKSSVDKLVLNYNKVAPEFNLRNNWKSTKGFLSNNKPLQIRLFKDVEDPNYNQVFVMPLAEFRNIYDGITLGMRVYNKTILSKPFIYNIVPQYATKSKSLTGSASISHRINIENKNLYNISYGARIDYRSFAENLFYRRIIPSISFNFRDHTDLRSNKHKSLYFRYIDINRDKDDLGILNNNENEPNYGIFNARYTHSNHNLITSKNWRLDTQFSDKFGKLSFTYSFRRLFNSSQQFNVRFYAGTFLYNNINNNSNYFDFAIDRPSDYLFDYGYLGRSEASGFVSQQYIVAEGGFKSKINPAFANQWITTANVGTSIWRYFQVYGDIGFVKNKYNNSKFIYDAGFRLNLVQDYFEVYFPVYSNLGWEISQPHYAERIRFLFTVNPKALLGIFKRRWF